MKAALLLERAERVSERDDASELNRMAQTYLARAERLETRARLTRTQARRERK
jgi:hypothetical protein